MASTLTTIWTALVLLLGLAESRHVWKRYRIDPPAPRWLLALLPLAAAGMLTMLWLRIATSPFENWNSGRIAPVLAWVRGMPLYFSEGQNPGTAFMYGPVAALVQLPAFIFRSPTGIILGADLINATLFFVPVVFFLCRIPGSVLLRSLSLLIFLGFSLHLESMHYSAFLVHADAPAVGFAMLSCAMITGGRSAARWQLALSAFSAVLSISSKQTMLPILLILPAYLCVRYDWRASVSWMAMTAALLAFGITVAIRAFGFEPMRFTMFTAISRHPWWLQQYGIGWSLFFGLGLMISEVAAPATAIAVAMLLEPRRSVRRRSPLYSMRLNLVRKPWLLPLLISMIFIPVCVAGRVKQGGYVNAFIPTNYFLIAALAGWVVCRRNRADALWAWHYRSVVGASCALCVALTMLALSPWDATVNRWHQAIHLQENPQQQAYEFSLEHPQEVLFPWNPLSTLLSENRYYLFGQGVMDLRLSKEFMSREHAERYLPARLRLIATPPGPMRVDTRLYASEFTRRVHHEPLPGWEIYAREIPATSTR